MLFPNAKRMNLKVVSPISDLWKRFQMFSGDVFTADKEKTIKGLSVRILELRYFKFRGGQYFLHPCLQEGSVDNLLVILKKMGMSVGSSLPPLMLLSLTFPTLQ